MNSIAHVILMTTIVFATTILADDQSLMTILPKGSEHTKDKGTNFVLTCILSVRQKELISNWRWLDPKNQTIDATYTRGNTKFVLELPTQQNQLRLILLNLEDAVVGNYTCAAEYDLKTITQAVQIKIIQPITFINAPEHQLARKGTKNFKLTCNVQAHPRPTVSWLKMNVQLTNNEKYIIENDGLIIRDVHESDDGSYSCEVLVDETGDFKKRAINLEVISEPAFFNTPEKINVTEGERATIPCNATGKPYPTFSWIKKVTMKNLTTSLSWDGRYNMDKVTKEDDDVFICVANNLANTVQREIKVNVQSKPQIVEVINSTIVTGKSGQLTCFVYGNPSPNVTIRKLGFKHHGQNYDTNDVRHTSSLRADSKGRRNTVEAVLKLDRVDRTDDGLYECVASNGIGETIGNLHLTVEYKPFFEKSAMVSRVVTWNKRAANLTCYAQAIPNATISWYYGTNPIPLVADSSYTFFTATGRSTLQVTPYKTVYGSYRCKAINSHGDDYYDIKLDEGFAPDPVKTVNLNSTTATSVTFEFVDPSFTGNLPIKAYIVQYIDQAQDWSAATKSLWPVGGPYILNDLRPGTKYLFRFASENDVGVSQWGAQRETQTPQMSEPSEPVISSRALDGERYIKSPFANRIELRWTIPSSNGLDIDKYAVRVCRTTEEMIDSGEPDRECRSIEIPYNTVLSSYVIEGLVPNTLYKVHLGAHNSLGFSKQSERIYKTNDVDEPGSRTESESHGEKMSTGLSSVVIIYIVVALLVGFLVIVDIFCFFVGKTGVIYTLCGSCCLKKKKKNDDKLGSESRDLITNGLKNKVDIEEQSPMITDGTKRDTAVEYDVKKGVSKTGFVGKDSAV